MTKKLYLMRHGQTQFNKLHKIQGACDSPLTQKGIDDAKKVGQYFKEHQLIFDHAYSSTQERASDTLELVTDQPYQRLKGLKEWNFGVFEGESENLNPKPDVKAGSYGDFFVPYEGEAASEVQERINQTLTEIMRQAKDNEKVLAVSHGGAIHMFALKWITERLPHITNCSVIEFEYDQGIFKYQKTIEVN
ncbi:histidine phosphatase family protein [Companilactobacillus sp. HBUAS56275]|uniref:Histidine phosphatase family protein n=1 Tax=Candidatus Companilactobacillus pullicola TaxID=2838523 RepID=A0A9D1ZK09_9LACO|nr:histidine phosphatase family protein [Candidatus Companilactobacillus pullicola]